MIKNIFNTTVETLTNDANILTKKYHDFINNGRTRESIDILRLLKDTLSLIKEYDWHLEYSKSDDKICIWEQNHSGEIRNRKEWFINRRCGEFWYKTFSYYIHNNESYLVEKSLSQIMRGSGKSEALARLCHEYNGIVISYMNSGYRAIQNRNEDLGYDNNYTQFVSYVEYMRNIDEYKNKIVFLDECHGLRCGEINKIKENNLVIGFEV